MFRPGPFVIMGFTDANMSIFKGRLPHIELWCCRKGLLAQMVKFSRHHTMNKPKSKQTKNTIDLQNALMGTSFGQNRVA